MKAVERTPYMGRWDVEGQVVIANIAGLHCTCDNQWDDWTLARSLCEHKRAVVEELSARFMNEVKTVPTKESDNRG